MVTLYELARNFSFRPEFEALIRNQGAQEPRFTKEEAARLLAIHDIFKVWPTIQKDDLLKTYKSFERMFNDPPTMTYERAFSKAFKIQLIPRHYLSQIDVHFWDKFE